MANKENLNAIKLMQEGKLEEAYLEFSNNFEANPKNYEALYFEELQKRHKVEDENERLIKALISVCLQLDNKKE